ncbi:MAG TPA: cytochrome c [Nitrospiraceae bacterium]|jgi:mono/diheme cytochrome c family protein|nr:cytochrome c [Nitrospiraceae bacterium]
MRRMWLKGVVALWTLGIMGGTPAPAEPGTPAHDLAKGKALYQRHCAGCHGPQGRGDGYRLLGPEPANLATPSTKGKSDEELLKTLHEGKPNMPAWKLRLSEQESRDVLAYVRSLAR